MILTDTGPIVALFDRTDAHYQRVSEVVDRMPDSMLTTEACLTEAIYLVGRSLGWPAVAILLQAVQTGVVEVAPLDREGRVRAFAFMERFRDQPCDYADATLLVAAEVANMKRIFTFDRHFFAYRLSNGAPLEIIP